VIARSENMMKKRFLLLVMSACALAALSVAAARPSPRLSAAAPQREVAVTFDDLPCQQSYDVETLRALTKKLLSSIASNGVPAIGFVNERKLHQPGELEARTAILKLWVDAGLELGNHTYSHLRLYNTPLDKFQEDVMRGEAVTKKLLAARGLKLRYFRHPTLNTGPNLATKRAFEKFLAARGYTVAPVTVDNSEWIFARVYAEAKEKGDGATLKRVTDAYVPYLEEMFAFYEQLSLDVLGYEVKQTLLLHANALNADHFDDIVRMLKRRGYRFISLEQALQDKAHGLPDDYTGPVGISWLQRWAITKGMKLRPEPGLPATMKQYDSSASGLDFKTGRSQ
jgi:peptidoglycan/xylan/chitin deacetylase (PgdA/CDA1 family)